MGDQNIDTPFNTETNRSTDAVTIPVKGNLDDQKIDSTPNAEAIQSSEGVTAITEGNLDDQKFGTNHTIKEIPILINLIPLEINEQKPPETETDLVNLEPIREEDSIVEVAKLNDVKIKPFWSRFLRGTRNNKLSEN